MSVIVEGRDGWDCAPGNLMEVERPAIIMSGSAYWDIDDILAEEDPVTVKLVRDVPGFGHLHGGAVQEDLKAEQKTVVPYWLALAMEECYAGDLEIPRHYGEQFKNTLIADATIVNLFEKSEFYYEMGAKLSRSKDPQISKSLCETLITRFGYILDHTSETPDSKVQKKLSSLERGIYEKGRKACKEQHEWKSGQLDRIAQGSAMQKMKRLRPV